MQSVVYFLEPMKDHIEIGWTSDVEALAKERGTPLCVVPNAKYEDIGKFKERFARASAADRGKRYTGCGGAYVPRSLDLNTFIADTNAAILYIGALYVALLNLKGQCNGRYI